MQHKENCGYTYLKLHQINSIPESLKEKKKKENVQNISSSLHD